MVAVFSSNSKCQINQTNILKKWCKKTRNILRAKLNKLNKIYQIPLIIKCLTFWWRKIVMKLWLQINRKIKMLKLNKMILQENIAASVFYLEM